MRVGVHELKTSVLHLVVRSEDGRAKVRRVEALVRDLARLSLVW